MTARCFERLVMCVHRTISFNRSYAMSADLRRFNENLIDGSSIVVSRSGTELADGAQERDVRRSSSRLRPQGLMLSKSGGSLGPSLARARRGQDSPGLAVTLSRSGGDLAAEIREARQSPQFLRRTREGEGRQEDEGARARVGSGVMRRASTGAALSRGMRSEAPYMPSSRGSGRDSSKQTRE